MILTFRGLLICSSVLLLNSCMFIFTGKIKKVRVITPEPARIVYQAPDASIDTIPTFNNEARLFFERSSQPVEFTVLTDTAQQAIHLNPINSFEYNYRNIPTLGLASLFLRSNPKSRSYPAKVYITSTGRSRGFQYFPVKNKGSVYAHISLPLFNHFISQPKIYQPQTNFGMLGVSIGVDYYYHDKRFITLEGMAALNVFPGSVHDAQAYEIANTVFIAASNNHDFGNSFVGYGITFGRNEWRIAESSLFDEPYEQHFYTVGMIGKIYHRFNTNWSCGLIYRPTFLRQNGTWAYEHLISFDLAWRIRLKK